MLMGRRITGLDIAPGRLIAVELVAGEVARARVAEAARDDVSGTQFEGWLRALEVRGELQVVAWDAGHIHRTLLLPPMPPSDRASFVERDLARHEAALLRAKGNPVVARVERGPSFARAVAFAMSQPDDVDINEILFRPTSQEL